MRTKTKLYLVRAGLLVAGALLPLTLISLIVLLNAVNPMALGFITGYVISNRTAEPILVAPVGTLDERGRRGLLGNFPFPFPAMPGLRIKDIAVAPGGRRIMYYDWDDIQFSEIVVRDSTGTWQIVVNAEPTKNQFRAVAVMDFAVTPETPRIPVAPAVLEAAESPDRSLLFHAAWISGLAAPLVFRFLWRANKRLSAPPPLPA